MRTTTMAVFLGLASTSVTAESAFVVWSQTVGPWRISQSDFGWLNCNISTLLNNPNREVELTLSGSGPILALRSRELRLDQLTHERITLSFNNVEYRSVPATGHLFINTNTASAHTQFNIPQNEIPQFFSRFADSRSMAIIFENGAKWVLPTQGSRSAKDLLDRCDADARSKNLQRMALDPTVRRR